jgi:hypothetical protein
MGIDPMNNISIIIRILFAITIFQQQQVEAARAKIKAFEVVFPISE